MANCELGIVPMLCEYDDIIRHFDLLILFG